MPPETPQSQLSNFRSSRLLVPDNFEETKAMMAKNRRANAAKTATVGRTIPSVSFATGRPRDPMFYWEQNNLPFDYRKPEDLKKIREYSRMLYITHPIIAACIDIYTRYPLTGLEPMSKDDQLADFYGTLMFDELEYDEFLLDVAREYWLVGEAFPLGSFNEGLGVWEDDELMNPNDIEVIKSPFLKEDRYEMQLPETLRKVLLEGQPRWEYEALMRSFPELKNFMGPDRLMPVSSVLMRHIPFKADPHFNRGLPILMRGFRSVMQEEMLNAAQDAVASRLYTPLILAKLGASANDLGTKQPWIPTDGDLLEFEESLDAALSADFRVLTHHFATDMRPVFGREQMPRMDADFDRLTKRILQVFGLSETMISGASQGQTYAADALNRDLVSQMLNKAQKLIQKFWRERCLVVAEAQEHFDYEEHGGKKKVIMEEILEVDEETGEQRIVEQPKLLVPELKIKHVTMQDDEAYRAFMETLRAAGVPISMKSRMVNVPLDLEAEREATMDEQVENAVAAQEARRRTYLALKTGGYPIPKDLQEDFGAHAQSAQELEQAQEEAEAQQKAQQELKAQDDARMKEHELDLEKERAKGDSKKESSLGEEDGGEVAEVGGGEVVDEEPVDSVNTALPSLTDNKTYDNALVPVAEEEATVETLPRNKIQSRPPESDEQRGNMPKSSYRLRTVKRVAKEDEDGNPVVDDEGNPVEVEEEEWTEVDELEFAEGANRLISGPSHIGRRRFLTREDLDEE